MVFVAIAWALPISTGNAARSHPASIPEPRVRYDEFANPRDQPLVSLDCVMDGRAHGAAIGSMNCRADHLAKYMRKTQLIGDRQTERKVVDLLGATNSASWSNATDII